eukprot:COSAG03_NODE_9273_length_732_cov_4.382306_1_plen_81_part_00
MLLVVHCIVRTQANQSPPPNGDCILFTEMCGHGTRHGTWHGTLHTSTTLVRLYFVRHLPAAGRRPPVGVAAKKLMTPALE